jgi:hypothetical protein
MSQPDSQPAPDGVLKCLCGSGLTPQKQYDGYGLFLCRTCRSCHARQMSRYRRDIREQYECDEPIYGDDY